MFTIKVNGKFSFGYDKKNIMALSRIKKNMIIHCYDQVSNLSEAVKDSLLLVIWIYRHELYVCVKINSSV